MSKYNQCEITVVPDSIPQGGGSGLQGEEAGACAAFVEGLVEIVDVGVVVEVVVDLHGLAINVRLEGSVAIRQVGQSKHHRILANMC